MTFVTLYSFMTFPSRNSWTFYIFDCNFIKHVDLKVLFNTDTEFPANTILISLYIAFFDSTYSTVQFIGVILNEKIGFPYFTIVWFHFSTFFTICCVQKLVCNKRFTAKVGRYIVWYLYLYSLHDACMQFAHSSNHLLSREMWVSALQFD